MEKITFDYSDEFIEFYKKLPTKDRAKLLATIKRIEEEGLETAKAMQWVKLIEKDLYEIRSKLASNIQRAFYFQVVNNEYYITSGFTKKTQKTPKREIDKAKEIKRKFWEENSHE